MLHSQKKPNWWHENVDNSFDKLQIPGENDRLSSLPDNLLITILSLIPFSSAVSTSVLSHRWRNLWTYITHIYLDKDCSFHTNKLYEFQNSITTTISKLTSPKIHTLHFHSSFKAQEQACTCFLVRIVQEICLRNPEVVKIFLYNSSFFLPTSLFTVQSLVELKLASFEFDQASDDAQLDIDLPNLKKLELSLCDSHRRLMLTIFKSLPLLECLYLHLNFNESDHLVDILAPNLKFLTIVGYSIDYFLIIDAPKLISLKTCEPSGFVTYRFPKSPTCLQEAEIIVPEYYGGGENDYLSNIIALFQGISYARSLIFNDFFHDHLMGATLPSFLNLVDLSFDAFHMDDSSWVPSCLLSNVKRIEIFNVKPQFGISFLRDVLSKAIVLEQLRVSLWRYTSRSLKINVGKEYEFAIKLFRLARSSPSCRVELSGEIITASSEDFRCGQLHCKLADVISDSDSDSESESNG